MVKIYVAMLFTTLIAFQVSGLYQDFNSYDFDQVNANVQQYADNTAGLYQSGFTSVINTVSGTIGVAESFVNGIISLGNFLAPNQLPAEPTVICVDYVDVSAVQNINYSSNRFWHNLFNDPNIETNEAWHDYLQVQRWGDQYTEICNV